jgi:very-short-patch-repair endonuclease
MEIDVKQHDQQKEYDDGRSAEMERYFIKVIRFTNSELEYNIEEVVKRIVDEVTSRMESPPWGI